MKRLLLFLTIALAADSVASAKTTSVVTLQAAPNPSAFGASVSLMATVSPATATGTVTFFDGVTILGSKPVIGGAAAIATIALPSGPNQLTALYGGDTNFAPAVSAQLSQTVNSTPGGGFNSNSSEGLSPSPAAFAVADFNGDGKPDLVGSSSQNTLVALGRGDGTFEAATIYTATGLSVAVGDFNGDGKMDVATGSGILLGAGDGTFASPIAYQLAANPLAVADFNGDGKADLVTSGGILLGNGDGTFGSSLPFAGTFLAVADFNGDGKPDLATADSTGNDISILLGNGNGTFASPVTYVVGTSLGPIAAVGDFNGDGKPDLAIVSNSNNAAVILNHGDGTFGSPHSFQLYTSGYFSYLAAADFNGDGKTDLVAVGPFDYAQVPVLLGNGDGTFTLGQGAFAGFASSLAVADFNGDGVADLAVAMTGTQTDSGLQGNYLSIVLGKVQTGTPFVTGQTLGPIRNNYTGQVGMKFTVGIKPITITSLGRFVAPGNSQIHQLSLVSGATGQSASSVSINLANSTPGQFQYVTLPSAVTLAANSAWFLVSSETAGGDQWYDYGAVSTISGASVVGPVYSNAASQLVVVNSPGSSYVPVSFQFSFSGSAAPTVTFTSPTSGATVAGTIAVSATASAATGLSITGLQFQVNGKNVGGLQTTAPFSVNLDTTTISNGNNTLSATATDSAGSTGTSSLQVVVNNSNSSPTPFLTGQPSAPVRWYYNGPYIGYVGMQFTVGSAPLVVSQLGRYGPTSQIHIVKLVNPNGTDVAGGSASIPAGYSGQQYYYSSLASPITLPANSSYILVSQEATGYLQDGFYDLGPVTANSVAAVNGGIYTDAGGHYVLVAGSAGEAYVPPNFIFTPLAAVMPPSVSITSPVAGPVSGVINLTATASAAPGLSIVSVQFQLNGSNFGPPLTGSPYTTTLDTTGLANGTYTLTAVATDSSPSSSTSTAVKISVSDGASPVPFLSGPPATALRNNYSGFVGMQFITGSAPLTLTQLGRYVVLGNSQLHIVKLVNANGSDVVGGSVSLSLSGAIAGQYAFAALASPITLTPFTVYYLVSQETSGGDQWYDFGSFATTNVASVNGAAYTDPSGNYQRVGATTYGPVNFLYFPPGAPTVVVTSPAAGIVSGTITVTASATESYGRIITGVQLKLNGNNLGSMLTSAPYTTTLDTTTLTNSTYTLTAVATDSLGETGTSAAVSITISNGATGPVPYLAAPPANTLRNNYSGFVGMQFTVGSKALTVSQLGRWVVQGNFQTHVVKLVNSNGTDVPGGTASITLSGIAAGQYAYATLTSPVTLQANTAYFLASQETNGGDQWYELGPVSGTAAATINGAVYADASGSYVLVPAFHPSQSYVPANFLYVSQ